MNDDQPISINSERQPERHPKFEELTKAWERWKAGMLQRPDKAPSAGFTADVMADRWRRQLIVSFAINKRVSVSFREITREEWTS